MMQAFSSRSTAYFRWLLFLVLAICACDQGVYSARPESSSHNEFQTTLLRGRKFQRALKIGDFAEINELMQGVEIRLINETRLGVEGVEVNITNVYCTHITIGDIQSNYTANINATSNQDTVSYMIIVNQISMQCFAMYSYNLGSLLQGSGSFNTFVDNSKVEVVIDFHGTSFKEQSPAGATVQHCKAVIHNNGNVTHEADGGDDIIGGAFSLFQDPVLALIDDTAADLVCEQIEKFGDAMLADVLNTTEMMLSDWLPPLNASWTDPLMTETRFFQNNPAVVLLDFLNSTSDENIFGLALNLATQYLGTIKTDNNTTSQESGVIQLLETYVLDEKGVFDLSLNGTNVTINREFPVTLDTQALVGKTLIRMNALLLTGLDKLTYFDPLVPIGRNTVSNTLAWEKLSAQVDLTVKLALCTPDNSILFNVTEDVTVNMDFINVSMLLSIFAPINKTELEGLFFNPVGLFDSILPILEKLEISGLNVTMSAMTPPIVDGFISGGLDRVISNFSEAIWIAYEPTLLRAIPGIFQVPLRHVLHSTLATFIP